MSVREEVVHLRRVPLFSGVAEEHLNLIAFAARDRELKDGKLLFKMADKPRAIYVVISGEVAMYSGKGRAQKLVQTFGEGAMLGELAVLCDRPHSMTARAVKDLRVLEIPKKLLFRSISEFPEMGIQMMRAVSARLADTAQDFAAIKHKFETGVRLADLSSKDQQ